MPRIVQNLYVINERLLNTENTAPGLAVEVEILPRDYLHPTSQQVIATAIIQIISGKTVIFRHALIIRNSSFLA